MDICGCQQVNGFFFGGCALILVFLKPVIWLLNWGCKLRLFFQVTFQKIPGEKTIGDQALDRSVEALVARSQGGVSVLSFFWLS